MWRHRIDQAITAGLWLSTIALVISPIVLAIDSGGVYRRTHYLAGLAVIAAMGMGLLSLTRAETRGSIRQHQLIIPLGLWLGFAFLQTISLPERFVRYLSPASAAAYTDWVNPLLHESDHLTSFPISLARHDSLHACASIGVVIGLTWLSASLFHQRNKTIALLLAISICGIVQAAIGIYRLVYPETTGVTISFGTFYNRNSAALMLNLGMAAGLGILFWATSAGDSARKFANALSRGARNLVGGPLAIVGLVSAIACGSALIVCGSRGGLAAAGCGLLLAFGRLPGRRGVASLPLVIATVAIGIALSVVSFDLSLKSFLRMEGMGERRVTELIDEKRVQHWKDGLTTAAAHLPLGSGLASYSYAHLPFQEDALPSDRWHHHADNLWLDLFTEQGVIGMLLALSIVWTSIVALRRLSRSSDPLDHGLRTTGWYCIGAVSVSMLFDSSLILYANLIVFAALLSAIVARSSVVPNEGPAAPRIRVTSRGERSALWLTALVAIAVIALSLPRLRQDTRVESVLREINETIAAAEFDSDSKSLESFPGILNEIAGEDPSPRALEAQFLVSYYRARLADVTLSKPANIEQFRERYLATNPSKKRLQWLQSQPETRVITDDVYLRAQQLAEACLKQLPLSRRERWRLLFLDFIARDQQRTVTLLDHLSRMYRLNPNRLAEIALYAADSRCDAIAAANWKRSLEMDPNLTTQVINAVNQYAPVEILQVLPVSHRVTRAAVETALKTEGSSDQPTLAVLYERLDCDDCSNRSDRSDCEGMLGDVSYVLGNREEAFTHYRNAKELEPFNVEHRIKLIQRLRDHGDLQAALEEARKARVAIPREERFTRLVETLGRED